MKTKREHFIAKTPVHPRACSQRGNALIYVLVAIVLLAALSMTLGRQTDTSEADELDDAKATMYATQLISYAAAAKAAIDQMLFTNEAAITQLDFTLPNQAGFNSAPTLYKVYHPDGGGLSPGRLPQGMTTSAVSDPVAGWYLGRFNNIEWTRSAASDVILVAFQISRKVCEKINLSITGSTNIPQMTASIRQTMIDDALYTGATNLDLTTDPAGTPICSACHKRASLCVEDVSAGTYGFYTVIADR
jgi:hypothetical protein